MPTRPATTPAPAPTPEPAADDDALTFGSPVLPGTYRGLSLSVEPVRIETDDGPKDLLRWTFVIDVDGHGEEIDALSSRNTGPRAKSYAWTTALLGRVPGPGERVRLADLSGHDCLVAVETDDNGYPKIGGIMAPTRAA